MLPKKMKSTSRWFISETAKAAVELQADPAWRSSVACQLFTVPVKIPSLGGSIKHPLLTTGEFELPISPIMIYRCSSIWLNVLHALEDEGRLYEVV